MAGTQDCFGGHRFFVADVAVVHDAGTVNVILVCTACGESRMNTHQVTSGAQEITLEKGKRDQ